MQIAIFPQKSLPIKKTITLRFSDHANEPLLLGFTGNIAFSPIINESYPPENTVKLNIQNAEEINFK